MQGRKLIVLTAVQIFGAFIALWLVFTRPGGWDWQRVLGASLVFAGLAGIVTARYQLGKSFSITPQARQLVTHGLYSKIRNPIYVFGTVLIAGIILVLRQPIGWLVVAAIIVAQTLRAHREAQVLEARFGEEYREYRRKTWF